MAGRPVNRLDPTRFPQAARSPGIDSARLLDAVRAYHLDEHDPVIRALVQRLTANLDAETTNRAARSLEARIAPHLVYHEDQPFVVAPPGTLSRGTFALHARQHADQQEIALSPDTLVRHLMLIGSSGAGKTTLAQQVAEEAYRHGLSVVTVDGKDDAAYLLTTYPQTLLIGPRAPIPLLEVPSWLSRAEYGHLITRALRRTWWGGQGTDQIGLESMEATYRAHEHPSIADWRRSLVGLRQRGDTYNRVDRIDAIASKLGQLIEKYPGIGTTPAGEGISLDDLCTRSTYFGFRIHTQVEDFLTNWLLELRFAHHRARNIRELDTLNVFDESVLLLHENTITETASIAPTFPLLREFGTACLLTTNNYRSLPDAVKSNVSTWVVMSVSDATEQKAIADTIGLTPSQRDHHATKLRPGDCILKTTTDWQLPVLATFENVHRTKSITLDEWRNAEARTNHLARTRRAPITVAGTDDAPTQHPTTAPPPITPVPPASPPAPLLALNDREESFLRALCERGIALVTELYDHLGLRPTQGDRVKRALIALGLVTQETQIFCRSGRGNKATPLLPTDAAYGRLRLTPPKLGRGSGPQHKYLLRELRDSLGATIEVHGCDLVLPYHTDLAPLIAALDRRGPSIAFNAGDVLAIEVELTTKHIAENLARNATNGLAATIILALPSDITKTTHCVQHLHVEQPVFIGDALAFLDAARATSRAREGTPRHRTAGEAPR